MSRILTYISAAVCALPLTCLSADEVVAPRKITPVETPEATYPAVSPAPVVVPVQTPKAREVPFSPFTGKVKGKKVRLRLKPDLDSQIIRELVKNDLLSIAGESGDFYAVQPPEGTKAYVFRSFILDNVVEGNRVNVRLEPNLEAPVIGHLNAGDKVQGVVSPLNNKWLEIAPTPDTRFYVAKEYIDYVGGPEVKAQLDKRRVTVEQLLDAAALLSKAEMRKTFEEIDINRLSRNYQTVISEYAEFPEFVEKAKQSLALLQETYIQKRIAFLETKAASQSEEAPSNLEEASAKERDQIGAEKITDRMRLWEPIEESLYLTWTRLNEDKNMSEFYDEQMLAAEPLTGILESYTAPVKNKPGDFILRDKDLPIAYLYSSQVNLQSFIGKKVTILGASRPNNNFAFPAFFVLSVE